MPERDAISEGQKAGVFSADLLLWLLCARLPVLDAVSVFVLKTPQVFYVSEFGWVASVIFLSILQYSLSSAEERGFVCRRARIAFLIGIPLCIFYCTFGDVLSNLLWCGMMIAVSYHAIRGLTYARTQTGAARQLRYFHIGVLCYVVAEYILWTSGCFRQGDSASFLYYGFDVLLTGCVFALLPATGRAVQA